ncbi:hypothetical protein ACH5RR_016826 [Cinchona calisaya]|uniref:DOG1 domain-containing protein n=1 Tax=Cinchona calisaya TaxID=153742 RepID=A0ABD2ZX48_9GENT
MVRTRRLGINNDNVEPFETFFQGWLTRQEHYLQELVQVTQCNNQENEVMCKELITRVLAHYNEYYEAKARVAQENVFLLFSPPWFSSFERTYLWIAGFRPRLVFRILSGSVLDLSEDQSRRIGSLTREVKEEEKELSNVLSMVQECMVSPEMVALVTQFGRVQNGLVPDMESEMERVRISMEALVECADNLREMTVTNILVILNSSQAIRFLIAIAQFQLTIRRYGLRRDAESQWA